MVAERRHLLAQVKLLEAKLERAETQLQQHQHRECKLLGFSMLADIWLHLPCISISLSMCVRPSRCLGGIPVAKSCVMHCSTFTLVNVHNSCVSVHDFCASFKHC